MISRFSPELDSHDLCCHSRDGECCQEYDQHSAADIAVIQRYNHRHHEQHNGWREEDQVPHSSSSLPPEKTLPSRESMPCAPGHHESCETEDHSVMRGRLEQRLVAREDQAAELDEARNDPAPLCCLVGWIASPLPLRRRASTGLFHVPAIRGHVEILPR
jgi:hypothetical protein